MNDAERRRTPEPASDARTEPASTPPPPFRRRLLASRAVRRLGGLRRTRALPRPRDVDRSRDADRPREVDRPRALRRPRALQLPRALRRRLRRRRSLRRHLLSENLRLTLAALLSIVLGLGAVLPLGVTDPERSEVPIPLFLILLIVMLSVYTLAIAGLTLWALSGQPRHRLVAAARLPRARRAVRFYRWNMGRTSAFSEVVQMLMMAVIAVLLLISPPPEVPITALLALTVAAVMTAWIGAVVTFAVEYAAEDSRGTAFSLPGTDGPDRVIGDYVYGAVLIQASSGAGELTPLTSAARRLVRHHVILAHVTSTIIITLGVSAVITAVA